MGNSCSTNAKIDVQEPHNENKKGETISSDKTKVFNSVKKNAPQPPTKNMDSQKNASQIPIVTESKKVEEDEIVKIVITEAVIEPEKMSQVAEIQATDIIAAARQKSKEKRAANKLASETMPPFMIRKKRPNSFQRKIKDLLDDPIQFHRDPVPVTPSTEDPIAHLHMTIQGSLNSEKFQVMRQLMTSEDKNEHHKLMATIIDKAVDMSPLPKEPISLVELTPEFMAAILAIHMQAQIELHPIYSMEEIHFICQSQFNENLNAGPPILVSPALREEARQFIQNYVAKNLIEVKSNVAQIQIPSLEAELMKKILATHETAQKLLLPPSAVTQIHQTCQLTITGQRPHLKLILVTRSEREDTKEFLRNLVGSMRAASNGPEKLVLPPLAISPDSIERILNIHATAQTMLGRSCDKSNGQDEFLKKLGQNVERLHQIAQFSIHKVAPPVNFKETIQILETSVFGVGEATIFSRNKKIHKMAPQPLPLPPHLVRKAYKDLQKIHLLTQQCFQNFGNNLTNKKTNFGNYEEDNRENVYQNLDSYKIEEEWQRDRIGKLNSQIGDEPLYAKIHKKVQKPKGEEPKSIFYVDGSISTNFVTNNDLETSQNVILRRGSEEKSRDGWAGERQSGFKLDSPFEESEDESKMEDIKFHENSFHESKWGQVVGQQIQGNDLSVPLSQGKGVDHLISRFENRNTF